MALPAEVDTVPEATTRVAFRRRHPLLWYVTRRIAAGLATTIAISVLIFIAITLLPGNVVEAVLGRNASPEQVAIVEAQLHEDLPAWERYLRFAGSFVTGDLGESTAALVNGQHVAIGDLVLPALGHSAVLAVVALVLFVPLIVVLGVYAGRRAGTARDSVVSSTALALGALPEFFVGTSLIFVFFTWLDWLPPVSNVAIDESVFSQPQVLILPIATLMIVGVAFGARQLRASVVTILSQDYVVSARINGYTESAIVRKYVLPNALAPTVQIVAQQLQYLVGGVIVVESVFNYPGVGNLLVRAINQQDTQQVLVIATILAAIYIVINVVSDVIAILLDPRVRTAIS